MENLFTMNSSGKSYSPLADRMRPQTLEEFFGQTHILKKGLPLERAIRADRLTSMIFWGPPGCGKTTLANIISKTCGGEFAKLNAVSCGVADVKEVIKNAKDAMNLYGKRTYLLLDECHRFNKAQLDSLLASIEDGSIVFIGSTTENPNVSLTRAILSRCVVYEFKKLTKTDLALALERAINSEKGLKKQNVILKDDAKEHLLNACDGDVRAMLNALELATLTTPFNDNNETVIDKETIKNCLQKRSLALDENLYYDLLSAFCKSLRGSDPDAGVYYCLRLIESGCDPMIIARRLIAHASEDIGLADSNALVVAVSAMQALQNIGLPEAKLSLCHATMYICLAPKSNAVYRAMESAQNDLVNNKDDQIPVYLKDKTYAPKEETSQYKYPHSYGGYVEQQYLPNSLKDRKYLVLSNNGKEKDLTILKDPNRNRYDGDDEI